MSYPSLPAPTAPSDPGFAWLPDALAFLRRRWMGIAAVTLFVMALAVAYILVATPKFDGTTTILIDTRRADAFRQPSSNVDSAYVNALVESQTEVLQSERIARQVVLDLKLVDDREFSSWGAGILGTVQSLIAGLLEKPGPAGNSSQRVNQAADALSRMTTVRRIGQTFVVEVTVRTPAPERSAQFANAIVNAYIGSELEAKYDATRNASAWLSDRLKELRDQSIAADQAVQDHKARFKIVDTEKGVMNEHELADLSTNLVNARSRTAETASRLARIQDIKVQGFDNTMVSDALQDVVIVKLTQEYLEDQRKQAEWSAKYGTNHAAAVNLRNRMKELQTSINTQLDRLLKATQSDYEVAKESEAGLQRRLDELVASSAEKNVELGRLRALQSLADTYRTLYATFLQRYTQAAQDQSFPIAEARVITKAEPPLRKSQPKTILVLGGGTFLGLLLGIITAFARDMLDQKLRTPAHVLAATGLSRVTPLPRLRRRDIKALGNDSTPRLPADAASRTLSTRPSILSIVVEQPFSEYAESLRSIWVHASQRRRDKASIKVIGCISATAGEGKSTVSANLAQLLATAGYRTLLADWDLRKPSLSRSLTPHNAADFQDVVNGTVALKDAIWHDSRTGLSFLPAPITPVSHPAAFLGSDAVSNYLTALRGDFDYIVLDLPPLGPIADVHATVHMVDAYVVVIEASRTEQDVVMHALKRAEFKPEQMLGVVLNKADMRAMPYDGGTYGYRGTQQSA